jgi:hypothetical protein
MKGTKTRTSKKEGRESRYREYEGWIVEELPEYLGRESVNFEIVNNLSLL